MSTPTGGAGHGFGIGHIPLILVDTVGRQRRVLSTGEASDVIPPLPEGPGDGSPNEAACSGHQCLHEWVPRRDANSLRAHTASFSRKILALWRTSTGKEGW